MKQRSFLGRENSRVCILPEKIGWFGAHTGYGCLTDKLASIDETTKCKVIEPSNHWPERLRGKYVSLLNGFGSGPQGYIASVHRLAKELEAQPGTVGHVLFGEQALPYLSLFSEPALERLVLTFHQPRALWTSTMQARLRRIRHGILLYSGDLDFFSQHMKIAPVVIKHAVDLDFFQPAEQGHRETGRVLFSGVHLRDIDVLYEVVSRLAASRPHLAFDFLVPRSHAVRPEMEARFRQFPIQWLSNLDDQQLRSLYQQSDLMLLPLRDSGANTAVIEALASGLPLATTDIGGIRDYGGGDVFPLAAPGDAQALYELTCRYVDNPGYRRQLAADSRHFAEQQLGWGHCVQGHLELYRCVR